MTEVLVNDKELEYLEIISNKIEMAWWAIGKVKILSNAMEITPNVESRKKIYEDFIENVNDFHNFIQDAQNALADLQKDFRKSFNLTTKK